jgi:hypothetical protein
MLHYVVFFVIASIASLPGLRRGGLRRCKVYRLPPLPTQGAGSWIDAGNAHRLTRRWVERNRTAGGDTRVSSDTQIWSTTSGDKSAPPGALLDAYAAPAGLDASTLPAPGQNRSVQFCQTALVCRPDLKTQHTTAQNLVASTSFGAQASARPHPCERASTRDGASLHG